MSSSKSGVLIPLYIYPNPGAWDPLHAAIAAHPNLHFLVIINPNNGPGSSPWWPNADYVREIPRLNAQPNVRTLGYVHTTYCRRGMAEVVKDIRTYADWSKDAMNPGIGLCGIFFDETPNLASAEAMAYLVAITRCAKDNGHFSDDALVIHNPGTAVEGLPAQSGPDITTVVEEAYSRFRTEEYQQWLSTSSYHRMQTSYMVHSVPEEEIEVLVLELRERAGWLFVTDLKTDFYHKFGASWSRFIGAMAV